MTVVITRLQDSTANQHFQKASFRIINDHSKKYIVIMSTYIYYLYLLISLNIYK